VEIDLHPAAKVPTAFQKNRSIHKDKRKGGGMNAKGKGKRKWKFSQKARFSMLQNEKPPTEDL
jgi:hypothetical protein